MAQRKRGGGEPEEGPPRVQQQARARRHGSHPREPSMGGTHGGHRSNRFTKETEERNQGKGPATQDPQPSKIAQHVPCGTGAPKTYAPQFNQEYRASSRADELKSNIGGQKPVRSLGLAGKQLKSEE
ncbi:unnamed protein product [Calypogeia fissa]